MAWHRNIKPTLRKLIPQADVVHIHGLWEEIQHRAAKLSRWFDKPYLFTPHGMLDPWSLRQGRLKKNIYLTARLRKDLDRASAIHFTDETERDVTSSLGLTPLPIVERLIIDLSDFQPPPPTGRFRALFANQLTHAQGERPFVLFMSRIHHKKGLDLLVPAFAEAIKRNNDPRTMLVIAGPNIGGYQATVEELVKQHGLVERVILPGMLYGRDRAAAMVDARLFALPSYQENFGVVIIEALAAGTPVLISDQVAIHRHVTEAQVGEVVTTKVEPLTEALCRWISDDTVRDAAAGRAQPYVNAHYDRLAQARRWVEHYQRLGGIPA
jgi:glycosyltransferase involved in cell wall biosynthesis